MVVSILADLSVLMCGILFFFLTRPTLAGGGHYTSREKLQYISLVTIVGVLLMVFSVVVEGARYDYRFLLYVLAIKYIGPEITVPSIIIVTLCRGFYGLDMTTLRSFVYGAVLALTISKVNQWTKRLTNDLWQLFALIAYTVVINAALNMLFWGNLFRDRQVYLTLVLSSFIMLALLFWMLQKIVGIHEKADFDFLTRLRNRRRFYLDLDSYQASKKYAHIVMIDIDYFKQINDRFGHLTGDEVLRMVAQVLQKYETKKITFYRIGGEEFAGLLEQHAESTVLELLEYIRADVAALATGHQMPTKEPLQVTISLGVAGPATGEELLQTLKKADDALYMAKANGRNRVESNE